MSSQVGLLGLGAIPRKKRVFISFRAEDRQQVNGVRLLAANPKFELDFYDESVRTPINSTSAHYIRQKIREKINRTSVTLCLVSPLTHTSQWVTWELEESIDQGNAIICMGFPNGPASLTMPEPIRRLGFQGWRWDLDFLGKIIDQAP
jgi:hypothetical protein